MASPPPTPPSPPPRSMAIGYRKLLPVLAFFAFLFLAPGPASAAAATEGLVFHVGGPRGWRVPDANTSYGWWAMNNRFHVGDQLYFKYENDSVLVVDREAFDGCNATAPLARFADGATTVRLGRPGFFCFISGEPGHCDEGQRLIVRVMVHPAREQAAAPGPGPAPAAQPGGGGGSGSGSGSGAGARHGPSGASSGAAAVAAGVALAAAMAVLVSLVLLLQ